MARNRRQAPAREATGVRIYTLGRFALEVDGAPVRFGAKLPRKPLELLKALVARGGDGVSVEQLSESLWPDLDGDNARNAFKSALSRLRKLVGADSLVQQGGRVSLDPGRCWADALACGEAFAACARALEAGDRAGALAALNQALELYRAPFLEGEYDPVELLAAREKLHAQFTRQVSEVAEALREGGDPATALSLYQRGLQADDVSEEFCAGLMECHAQQGRPADAVSAYVRFRHVLEARMGVQPSAALEARFRALEQEAAAAAQSPGDDHAAALGPGIAAESAPAPEVPAEGERRQVTALAFTMAGLSALEQEDPEAAEQAIRTARETAQAVVEEHGGIVNQFLRDEMVAFFGIPVAREDDAARAVRAALALCERLQGSVGDAAGAAAAGLACGAGVDTGLVLVKPGDGSGGRYAVSGLPASRAATLSAQAGARQVLLSGEAHELVEPYFEAQPWSVAGDGARDTAVQVLRESAVQTPFEAAERRGLSPFVGRAQELATLRGALAQARRGQGRFVSVVGEPGIGKSRLLHEFRLSIPRERVSVLQGHCHAGGLHTPYLPLVAALRRGLQLPEQARPEEQAKRAVSAVRELDPALEAHLPALLHVLTLPAGEHELPKVLQGLDLRVAVREALGAVLSAGARRQPIALLLEDWHWADEASTDALRYLLTLVESTPLLVVVTERVEGATAWPALAGHARLALRALADGDSAQLLRGALRMEALTAELQAELQQRTGGNPFFIESVCGHLRAGGEGAPPLDRLASLRLPPTVQAVVRSRLDLLDADTREALQVAAVLGHQFSGRILERVHGRPAPLAAALERLKAQELIRQTAVLPEPAYRFNHVITAEVAYDTLTQARRRALHASVALAIETHHAERLAEHTEALAEHHQQAGNWERAIHYHLLAGNKAKGGDLMRTALHHYDQALRILTDHRPDVPWRLHYDLLMTRKEALGEFARWPQAYHELGTALELARASGDEDLVTFTLFQRANVAFWGQLFKECREDSAVLEKRVKDDPNWMLGVATMQMLTTIMMDRFEESLSKEPVAAALLEQAPNSPHIQNAVWYLAVFERWRGNHAHAIELFERVREMQKVGVGIEPYSRTIVFLGMAQVDAGLYQEAIDAMEAVLAKALPTDSFYSILKIRNTLGWAYAQVYALDAAEDQLRKALVSADELRGPRREQLLEIDSFSRVNLAEICLQQERLDEAQELLETVYANSRRPLYHQARPRWKPRCLILLGEYWLHNGGFGQCERFLAELDEHGLYNRFPFGKFQVRAARLRADLMAAKGNPEQAIPILQSAMEAAHALAMPAEVWKTHAALARHHAAVGQSEAAADQYRRARKELERIAATLTDVNLRETFLAAAPVQDIFRHSRGA